MLNNNQGGYPERAPDMQCLLPITNAGDLWDSGSGKQKYQLRTHAPQSKKEKARLPITPLIDE
jgi:hypothetical protein